MKIKFTVNYKFPFLNRDIIFYFNPQKIIANQILNLFDHEKYIWKEWSNRSHCRYRNCKCRCGCFGLPARKTLKKKIKAIAKNAAADLIQKKAILSKKKGQAAAEEAVN